MEYMSPEIPDSSKWSSNENSRDSSEEYLSPEIPDSSKWSSNMFPLMVWSTLPCLKYQIPVSGVQT